MTAMIQDLWRVRHSPLSRGMATAAALSLALLCTAAAAASAPKAPPQFTDYPTTARDLPGAGTPPRLRLATPATRRYTTVLHEAYKEPANFAGHLRVALWGCGTDCRSFAVLDQRTGTAYTLPRVALIAGVMGNDDERVDFRPDSRLLVIAGSINDAAVPGKYYYLWTGRRLERIFSSPLAVEPIDTSPPPDASAPGR